MTRGLIAHDRPAPQYLPQLRHAAGLPCEREFTALREAYRASGGTVRRDALSRVLQGLEGAPEETLGKLLVTDEVFSFEWRTVHWVPLFQLDLRDMSIKPRPRRVAAELSDVFDGWALAVWFCHPNARLRNQRPVDLLDSRLSSVLSAARADRFVAAG